MQRRGAAGLAAVLFTDIVGSTQVAAEMGDRRWRELIGRHHATVRRELKRHRGRENDTAGDGFFATFERPADAIRCAAAAAAGVRELGIEIRAGVSFGEVEEHEGKAGGMVVVTAARVMSVAGPGEILVPAVVADLIPGSGIRFDDHGTHMLKGIDGEMRVRSVAEIDGEPLALPSEPDVARERRAAIQPVPVHRRRYPLLAAAGVVAILVVIGIASILRGDDLPDRPGSVAIAAEWDVIAIDPQQPLPVSARISPGDWETHGADFDRLVHTVVVGEQSVFVVRRNCAVQIDPKLGDVRNRLCPGRDIAVGFDRMWFTFADVVRGADLYTGEELEPIQVRDPSTFTEALSGGGERIATGLGSVWVGYRDGILSRLDVGSGEVTTRRIGEAIDSMAVGGGAVWLGDRFDGSLAILDVETGSIERIDLGAVTPDELVYDEASQKAWALDVFSDLVVAIDRDGASQTVPVGADPTDIAVGIDRVWVTDLDGILREVNPTTGRVREVLDVGLPLWAVGVDEETALVWLDVSPPPRREFA